MAIFLMASPGVAIAQVRIGTIAAGKQFDLQTLDQPAGLIPPGKLLCVELTPLPLEKADKHEKHALRAWQAFRRTRLNS